MAEAYVAQLPVLTVAVLVFAASLAFVVSERGARNIALVTALVEVGLAFSLAVAVATTGEVRHTIGGWGAPLGIDYAVDGISAALIALTAAIGLLVTVYAAGYFGDDESCRYFWPLWLFLWGSLVALFSSNDVFNLYVCLELVTVSAVALVAIGGTRESLVAAMRYMLVAIAGSLFYLFGVAMLYGAYGVLDIDALTTTARANETGQVGLALVVTGLVVKTALVPMHFWLPPAHSSAPAPVSAVLSALVVKGSFYIILRISGVFAATGIAESLSLALGMLGAVAIAWGSIQAFRQARLKMLVAYSTVAQIGYLFVLFGLTGSGVDAALATMAVTAGVFHAVSHALAKGAMFLVAGTIIKRVGHDRVEDLVGLARSAPALAFTFAAAGVSMVGLPPSGGFASKWLYVSAALGSGAWIWAVPVLAGGLLAAAYVFRVVAILMRAPAPGAASLAGSPAAMTWGPLTLAVASLVLGVFGEPVVRLITPAAASILGVAS